MKTAVIFSAVLLAATGCVRHPELPVYGQVPEFQLISQTGQTFDRRQLDGKIWAADFIYTHCPGPCPRMSSQLQRVQTAVAELPNVRLVSFSVDNTARDLCWLTGRDGFAVTMEPQRTIQPRT